ncbi:MAG: ATP-binding protein [Desulfuromonadales bacterium]
MYGQKMNSKQLKKILNHIFRRNDEISSKGGRSTPVMIWGTHGLGKTQMVTDFVKENGWKLAYCAPAQFEEMGDLHGIPVVVDPDKNVSGDEYTVYRPPEWAPKLEGPGILLLDDINRADDRILRGTMQLLQNFELMSWSLPPKWQIVCTANPDNSDYSVTPMDDAMLTRLLHTTMLFEPRVWAEWAYSAGIDKRCISFVLTYPECVTGKRTTPRSLAQFFQQIETLPDFKAELDLVVALAMSSLDDITVTTFVSFINDDLQQLIDPEEILQAEKFADVAGRISELAKGKNGVNRVDRIATICSRLYIHLTSNSYKPGTKDAGNLVEFLLMKEIPNDLKMSLYIDLQREASKEVRAMLDDKRLARFLVSTM